MLRLSAESQRLSGSEFQVDRPAQQNTNDQNEQTIRWNDQLTLICSLVSLTSNVGG